MLAHRRHRATPESPAIPIRPVACLAVRVRTQTGGAIAPFSLSLLLHDAHRHHVVAASRNRGHRARNKRRRIYEPRYLAMALLSSLLLVAAARAQSTETPPPAAFGESEYRLGPEDIVQVWIWKEIDSSVTAMVRPDGKVSLPLVGEVQARGKTVHQLQDEITERMRAYIANPVVTVIVTEINSPQISVLGKVEKPDLYKIRQRITVLDAIAMAGGFTEFAKRDKVVIIRNNSPRQQILRVDLKRPDKIDGDAFYLQPSDIVYVQ